MVTDSAKIFVLQLLALFFSGCATASFDVPKPYSKTITDTADTRLGKEVSRWVAAHDGLPGSFSPQGQPLLRNRGSGLAGTGQANPEII